MAFQNQFLRSRRSIRNRYRRALSASSLSAFFKSLSFSFVVLLAACACANKADGSQIGDSDVKVIVTQLRGFGVPFNINADVAEFIELHLYVTRDKGVSWQFYGRESTDSKEFPFKADEDGEYWFALKTLNRDKKLLPEGAVKPELRVIVDTVKPTLQSSIDADSAGRIVCLWTAKDKNIDPKSLRILYRCDAPDATQTERARQWTQVPITLTADVSTGVFRDQVAWWPESNARSYEVRLEIADLAGNTVHRDSHVNVPLVAWRNQTKSTAHAGNWAAQTARLRPPGTNVPIQQKQNQIARRPQQPVKRQTIHGKQKMVCEGGVCTPVSGAEQYIAHTNNKFRLVGSQIEYVDPPIPEGEEGIATSSPTEQRNAVTQTPFPSFRPKSIPWSGTTEDPIGEQNLAVGSTLGQRRDPTRADPPNQTSNVARNNFGIRSLPPVPRHANFVNSTTRELPGGMFVTESTARRKPSTKRLAEFRANVQPPWQGRGVADKPSWQNELVKSSPVKVSPRHGNQHNPSSRQSESVARNVANNMSAMPVSFGLPGRAPEPRPLNVPRLEAMQPVNSRRFNLNYGIDAIDPSGVQRVDLWMTRDGGLTWKSWATDPDRVSPFPVQVDEQGEYGFRIVVQSRDGLTGLAPRRGDKADMWVNVDTDAPLVKITSVPYGRGNEAGKLVINWNVQDSLLTLRPITLSFSTDSHGPWTAIESGLRNTGRYVWKVGTNVPERIFLRLDATDQAGNVGLFQLNNLIDLSGLVPRGHIKSVEPFGLD